VQTCEMICSENVAANTNSRKSSGVIFCMYSPQASYWCSHSDWNTIILIHSFTQYSIGFIY